MCWKIPRPPPILLESLHTIDYALFVIETSATNPPEELNSLLNVLQARGEKIVFPRANKGLILVVVPSSESPTCNLTSLLRCPTAPTWMEMPVVEVRKHGLWFLAKNVSVCCILLQLCCLSVSENHMRSS